MSLPTTLPTLRLRLRSTHLDATTVLSAVRLLSRAFTPLSTRLRPPRVYSRPIHRRSGALRYCTCVCRRCSRNTSELQDIIAILGIDELERGGQKGRYTCEKDTAFPLAADTCCGKVLGTAGNIRPAARDACAASVPSLTVIWMHIPRRRSYNVGTIDDVKVKAEQLAKEGNA